MLQRYLFFFLLSSKDSFVEQFIAKEHWEGTFQVNQHREERKSIPFSASCKIQLCSKHSTPWPIFRHCRYNIGSFTHFPYSTRDLICDTVDNSRNFENKNMHKNFKFCAEDSRKMIRKRIRPGKRAAEKETICLNLLQKNAWDTKCKNLEDKKLTTFFHFHIFYNRLLN